MVNSKIVRNVEAQYVSLWLFLMVMTLKVASLATEDNVSCVSNVDRLLKKSWEDIEEISTS